MHPFNTVPKPDYDVSRFVYHYTKLETAKADILPSRTLLFRQLAHVNDPKESISNDWTLFGNAEEDFADINDRVIEYFRLNVKTVCFSRDDQSIDYANHGYLLNHCCKGHIKPRMWATYGDNHKGVCLVFDRERLASAFGIYRAPDDRLLCGAVEYGGNLTPEIASAFSLRFEELAEDFMSTISRKIDQHSSAYFFFKHSDWAAENEYRFVLVGNEQKDVCLPYDDSLVGIALGIETPKEEADKIVSLANKAGVPVIQTIWGLNHSTVRPFNELAKKVMAG